MSLPDLKGRVVITNAGSSVLTQVRRDMDAVANASRRIDTSFGQRISNAYKSATASADHFHRSTLGYGAAAAAAGLGLRGLIDSAKEFNAAIWGANAAFLGSDTDARGQQFENDAERLKAAREQAVALREAAKELSRQFGLMPETFAKAGEEAAKMGVSFAKAKGIMLASGLVQMSDREAKSNDIAKALGTYGIIYGSPDDDAGYNQLAIQRASMLALAGAKTRTSASKIEEGLRNYMGIHGAFGGSFEDAVAMVATGSQLGQLEKETGTALKSMISRFLNMPALGRSALAAAGIDLRQFMDFSGADPMRAANQIVQLFPQRLNKGARGSIVQFLEKARGDGSINDPQIINRVVQHLEKLGMKFAGAEDREAASNKIAAIMHSIGGKFDPIGAFAAIAEAVESGKAGAGIWSAVGEPKRIHQNVALMKAIKDIKRLREELKQDLGRYLGLVAQGFSESEAGRIVRLEASLRRLQLALVNSEVIQSFVQGLADIAEAVEKLDPVWASWVGGLAAGLATLTAVGLAVGVIGRGLSAIARVWPAVKAITGIGTMAAGAAALGAGGSAVAARVLGRAGLGAGIVGAPILGPGAAAAAGVAGIAAGRMTMMGGLRAIALGAGRFFVPGLGIVMLGMTAYGAYQGYQETGTVGGAVRGALGLGNAKADTVPKSDLDAAGVSRLRRQSRAPGMPAEPGSEASAAEQQVQSSMDRIRATVQSVDLTMEGQRIMQTLAAGMRIGAGEVDAVMGATMGRVRAQAGMVKLNTGANVGAAAGP